MPAYVGAGVDCLMSDLLVQVYLLGVKCKNGRKLLYVCECGDMAATRDALLACGDLSSTTVAGKGGLVAGKCMPACKGVWVALKLPWITDREVTGSNLPKH